MQVVREDFEPVVAVRPSLGKRVTDPTMARAILEAMSDDVSRRILSSTTAKGKPVEEISLESNIPPSTTYRRVQDLSEMGLLVVERIVISESGKRCSIFRSAFRSVLAELQAGELHVEVALNEDVAERFYRMRQSIRFG
jgi:predicted transcriptional regulator